MSKKTIITLSDVARDERDARKRTAEQAVQRARFQVIEAKRSLCGRPIAHVDGHLVDAGVDGRSDVRAKR